MIKQQTVVEWLVSELKKSLPSVYNNEFDKEIKQAKEMEKQQIIDAFEQGQTNEYYLQNRDEILFESAEQYYNETFNK